VENSGWTNVPEHVYRLIETLGPNENLAHVDLNSANSVTAFMEDAKQKRKWKSCLDEILNLYRIHTVMQLSCTFDKETLEIVDNEVEAVLSTVPFGKRQDLLNAARDERQKQILGEMVDTSLLDPESNLFKKLIRSHSATRTHKSF